MRMSRIALSLGSVVLAGAAATLAAQRPTEGGNATPTEQKSARIQVVPNEAARRVDVTIDGKPFTSYIWPTTLKKPTLFPLRSANGTVVTRGFPLEPRKGERVDHPAPRRAVVEPRRRQRVRLLEQLRCDPRGPGAEDGDDRPPSGRRGEERRRCRRADGRDRVGEARRQSAAAGADTGSCSAAPPIRARSIASRR